MVDAARQVATLALLFSHHADVTQVAVDAMQQEVFLTFAKDSQEIRHNRKLRKKFAGIRKKFASIRNHL